MYQEIQTNVESIMYEDEKIQILKTSSGSEKAILYRDLFVQAVPGDSLIVNHTAAVLKLGTGGFDIVKHVLHKEPYTSNSPGHIMKARYTPNQLSVLSVEAQESPYHPIFLKNFTLNGRFILLAELHSMIPTIYQMIKNLFTPFIFTVIIDDAASLPLAFSEHMRVLHKNENFHTITIGQAYGGEYEAVNLQTALQFAVEELKSDFIVVSLGPGVVGTGTVYGYSGLVLANWANIIGSLDGVPVWVPRISFADERERHCGLSHHTITPLKQFTYAKSVLPLPILENSKQQRLLEDITDLQTKKHITIHWTAVDEQRLNIAIENYPIPIKTMGRTINDDPYFFYGIFSAVYWLVVHT